MQGQFGMGVGWNMGIPGIERAYTNPVSTLPASLIQFPNTAVTKIGLNKWLVLEPTLGITVASDMAGGASSESYAIFLMGLASFVASSHEKTNVYVKAGLKFGYFNPPGAGATTEFGIPAGIGLEYFVTKHFAVDVNTLSGLMTTSQEGSSNTTFSLSNQIVAVGLLWYH